MNLLQKYTEQATHMDDHSLAYSIEDIKKCWKANPEFEAGITEYSKKLWAEWDAFTVELQKRRDKKGGKK